ncbi:MAG: hypothetical protein B6D58_04575 [candidate division Zixibacteria bacterium 4484_95]|nr:MAG: hypothetical protein B6D58_04575 [candidate division Zixibacteria bacterium 4484_95]
MAKLVVIIVSWNTVDLTRDCLRSLYDDLKGIDNEVWVVDNHSSDDSVNMIKSEFPQVKLIENTENVGFAKANNQALREAMGDYYLLLNSDTIIPSGSIRAICDFMENNSQASAAGPKMRDADGVVQLPFRSLPSIGSEIRYCLVYHFFPLSRIFKAWFERKQVKLESLCKPIVVDVLSAACLIIRKDVIDKVGVLAEEYFLFSEENDYFYRMRKAGFKSYFLPDIEIIHLVGRSRRKRNIIDSEVNFVKSRKIYFKKFHRHKLFLFKAIYYFFFSWSCVMAKMSQLLKGKGDNDYFTLYRTLLKTIGQRE